MAANLVQSKFFVQATDAASWAATFDAPTTAGNLIIAAGSAADTGFDVMSTGAANDGGANTVQSVSQSNLPGGSAFIRTHMFYVPNCVSSSTFTIVPTSSGTFLGTGDWFITEWSGMTIAPLDGAGTPATGTTSPGSAGSLTPSGAGIHIAVIGVIDNSGPTVFTPDGAWTVLRDAGNAFRTQIMWRPAVQGAGLAPSWPFTPTPIPGGGGWAGLHAVFLETLVVDPTTYHPINMVS